MEIESNISLGGTKILLALFAQSNFFILLRHSNTYNYKYSIFVSLTSTMHTSYYAVEAYSVTKFLFECLQTMLLVLLMVTGWSSIYQLFRKLLNLSLKAVISLNI